MFSDDTLPIYLEYMVTAMTDSKAKPAYTISFFFFSEATHALFTISSRTICVCMIQIHNIIIYRGTGDRWSDAFFSLVVISVTGDNCYTDFNLWVIVCVRKIVIWLRVNDDALEGRLSTGKLEL